MNTTTKSTVSTVNFHGDSLSVIAHDGQPFVAMRPIVESMGLVWAAQTVKLNANKPRWSVSIIETVADDGKLREMLCLPLRKLSGWLATISPNKVKPELREKVIAYQNECDDALWAYWNDGIAVRTSYVAGPDDILSAAQAEQLRLILKAKCDSLPKGEQGAFMIKAWSKLKSHFGCAYRKIPQREFTEALSLAGRHAAEWEVVEEVKPERRQLLVERDGVTTVIDATGKSLIRAEQVHALRRDFEALAAATTEMRRRLRICFGDINSSDLDEPLTIPLDATMFDLPKQRRAA